MLGRDDGLISELPRPADNLHSQILTEINNNQNSRENWAMAKNRGRVGFILFYGGGWHGSVATEMETPVKSAERIERQSTGVTLNAAAMNVAYSVNVNGEKNAS